MEGDIELKNGSALRVEPLATGSANDAYGSVTLRQKNQLDVSIFQDTVRCCGSRRDRL